MLGHLRTPLVVCAAALAGCATIPPGNFQCASPAPAGRTAWFAGDWTTNYGPLHIDQSRTTVQGSYTDTATGGTPGTLSGTVVGQTMTLHWTEGQLTGDAQFTLCAGAASFAGGYSTYPWSGTLVPGSAPPEPKAEPEPRSERRPVEAAPAEKPWWQQGGSDSKN